MRDRGDGRYGLITTLMQPSLLSRKVLYASGPLRGLMRWVTRNDGSILPSSLHQRCEIGLDVCLARSCQPFADEHSHRHGTAPNERPRQREGAAESAGQSELVVAHKIS